MGGGIVGRGIYSTPKPRIAEGYSSGFEHKDKEYKIMLQNRVNMNGTKIPKDEKDYFVTADPKILCFQ